MAGDYRTLEPVVGDRCDCHLFSLLFIKSGSLLCIRALDDALQRHCGNIHLSRRCRSLPRPALSPCTCLKMHKSTACMTHSPLDRLPLPGEGCAPICALDNAPFPGATGASPSASRCSGSGKITSDRSCMPAADPPRSLGDCAATDEDGPASCSAGCAGCLPF